MSRYPWILGWAMIAIFSLYVLLTNVTVAWQKKKTVQNGSWWVCVSSQGILGLRLLKQKGVPSNSRNQTSFVDFGRLL